MSSLSLSVSSNSGLPRYQYPEDNCVVLAKAHTFISRDNVEMVLGKQARNPIFLDCLRRLIVDLTNNKIDVTELYIASRAYDVCIIPNDGRQVVSFTEYGLPNDPLVISEHAQTIFASMYNKVKSIKNPRERTRKRQGSSPSPSGNTSPTSVAALNAVTNQPVVSSMNVGPPRHATSRGMFGMTTASVNSNTSVRGTSASAFDTHTQAQQSMVSHYEMTERISHAVQQVEEKFSQAVHQVEKKFEARCSAFEQAMRQQMVQQEQALRQQMKQQEQATQAMRQQMVQQEQAMQAMRQQIQQLQKDADAFIFTDLPNDSALLGTDTTMSD